MQCNNKGVKISEKIGLTPAVEDVAEIEPRCDSNKSIWQLNLGGEILHSVSPMKTFTSITQNDEAYAQVQTYK